MSELPYTVLSLGDIQLHQLHTSNGKMFVMSEVAVELFQENPSFLAKELRAGRYGKIHTTNRDVIRAVQLLGMPVESSSSAGITLVAAETVEALLTDRRQGEMVQPFRLALLKLASQEAARLMASGEYELALPVALDAVKQGQALFRPSPALQLFPLYLLAAQANLGLKRTKQCEDFLGLASWLSLKEPASTTNVMRSQLSRLFGQLYALQGKLEEALHAFAEDVYYCALEYGPEDVRTSLGYYNLSKVFQSQGALGKAMACNDHVVGMWGHALRALVLGDGDGEVQSIPLGRSQLLEVVDMLQDICQLRATALGVTDPSVGDAHFTSALALVHVGEVARADEQLALASNTCPAEDVERVRSILQRAF
mmetsp:Transcript_9412/g.30930  ORF Transcript_9412/g.30930 Transcript_9412/m.30930 type:complete len:368 (-) Transcript_9412:45-1148(-)